MLVIPKNHRTAPPPQGTLLPSLTPLCLLFYEAFALDGRSRGVTCQYIGNAAPFETPALIVMRGHVIWNELVLWLFAAAISQRDAYDTQQAVGMTLPLHRFLSWNHAS